MLSGIIATLSLNSTQLKLNSEIKKLVHRQCWSVHFWRQQISRGQNGGTHENVFAKLRLNSTSIQTKAEVSLNSTFSGR